MNAERARKLLESSLALDFAGIVKKQRGIITISISSGALEVRKQLGNRAQKYNDCPWRWIGRLPGMTGYQQKYEKQLSLSILLQKWIYIYFIIFENMDYGNNLFCQQYYYILVPASNSCLLTTYAAQSQAERVSEINAEKKGEWLGGEAKIMVTREDLLEQGYEQTKKAWTEQEDSLLLRLCSDQNTRFDQIAHLIPGRNAKMCYSRFRRLSNQSKECWSKAENEKLQKLVEELGREDWKAIALNFPNRNYKQLKDHYDNYLRPNLTTKEWTLAEDLLLIDLVNEHGLDWKVVQKRLPLRSRNQIKNRLFGRILRIHEKKAERGDLQ